MLFQENFNELDIIFCIPGIVHKAIDINLSNLYTKHFLRKEAQKIWQRQRRHMMSESIKTVSF